MHAVREDSEQESQVSSAIKAIQHLSSDLDRSQDLRVYLIMHRVTTCCIFPIEPLFAADDEVGDLLGDHIYMRSIQ